MKMIHVEVQFKVNQSIKIFSIIVVHFKIQADVIDRGLSINTFRKIILAFGTKINTLNYTVGTMSMYI